MTIRERWQRICAGKSVANNTATYNDNRLTAMASAMLSPTNTYTPRLHRHQSKDDPNRRTLSRKSSNRSFLANKLPWRFNSSTDSHEDTIRHDMEPTSHPRPRRDHEPAPRKKPTEKPQPTPSKRTTPRKPQSHDRDPHPPPPPDKDTKPLGSIRRRNNLKDKGTRKRKTLRQRQREREREIDKLIFTPDQQHHQEMLRSYTFPFVEEESGEEGGGGVAHHHHHHRRKSSNVSPYSSRPGSLMGGEDLGRGIGGLSLEGDKE